MLLHATLPEQDSPAFPLHDEFASECYEFIDVADAEPQDDWWLDLGYVALPLLVAV